MGEGALYRANSIRVLHTAIVRLFQTECGRPGTYLAQEWETETTASSASERPLQRVREAARRRQASVTSSADPRTTRVASIVPKSAAKSAHFEPQREGGTRATWDFSLSVQNGDDNARRRRSRRIAQGKRLSDLFILQTGRASARERAEDHGHRP